MLTVLGLQHKNLRLTLAQIFTGGIKRNLHSSSLQYTGKYKNTLPYSAIIGYILPYKVLIFSANWNNEKFVLNWNNEKFLLFTKYYGD
jgi:hypothetical protein